jgi:hypothetical protein
MSSEKRTAKNKYRLGWQEYGNAEELLDKLDKLVVEPMRNAVELDGDMYLSDFRKLTAASWTLQNRKE